MEIVIGIGIAYMTYEITKVIKKVVDNEDE